MKKVVVLIISGFLIMAQTNTSASEQRSEEEVLAVMLNATREDLSEMINNGVNINSFTTGGTSIISYVANFENPEKLLNWLELGVDVNTINRNGSTPLYWAISGNNVRNLKLLLKYGANVNHRNKIGETPLHLAIKGLINFNSPQIPIILIKSGADVNALDQSGKSPLNLLRSQKKYVWGPDVDKIEEMLVKMGGKDISTFTTDSLIRAKNGQTSEYVGTQQKRSKHKERRKEPECGIGRQYDQGENCELSR